MGTTFFGEIVFFVCTWVKKGLRGGYAFGFHSLGEGGDNFFYFLLKMVKMAKEIRYSIKQSWIIMMGTHFFGRRGGDLFLILEGVHPPLANLCRQVRLPGRQMLPLLIRRERHI